MGCTVAFLNMEMMHSHQIRIIIIFITSNLDPFFVLGTLKIFSSSYFETYSKLLLTLITTKLCCRTFEPNPLS